MSNTLLHKFTSAKANDPDTTLVRPTNWNDEHIFSGGTNHYRLIWNSGATDKVGWEAPSIYNALNFGCVGNGATDDRTAINTLNTTGGIIYFPSGTYRVGSNLTLSNNSLIIMAPGAKLAPDVGTTLTINNEIIASNTQIFGTAGSIRLPNMYMIPAWWWGLDATGFQQAVNCAQASSNGVNNNPSLLLGSNTYSINTTIQFTGIYTQISIIGSPYNALQNSSTYSNSVIKWTGGGNPIFQLDSGYRNFYNFAIVNAGTASYAFYYTAQGNQDRFHRISTLLPTGAAAFSGAIIRYDAGTDYTHITDCSFASAAPRFIDYYGTGTDLYIEDSIFDTSTAYTVLYMNNNSNLDQVVFKKNTFNSQSNVESLIYDASGIGAGVCTILTVENNEVDAATTTAGHRFVKVVNTKNFNFNRNQVYCNGTVSYFGDITNSTVYCEGNNARSISGPLFDFTDTVSALFPGHNTLDSNTKGITDSTDVGVVQVTYASTCRILGQAGNPGSITSYIIKATNNSNFDIVFAKPPDATWGYMTPGQFVNITVQNTSGGAMGTITFANTHFKCATYTLTAPANGKNRSILCYYDGSYLVEVTRGTADVDN